jgi:hypothetical protein
MNSLGCREWGDVAELEQVYERGEQEQVYEHGEVEVEVEDWACDWDRYPLKCAGAGIAQG